MREVGHRDESGVLVATVDGDVVDVADIAYVELVLDDAGFEGAELLGDQGIPRRQEGHRDMPAVA